VAARARIPARFGVAFLDWLRERTEAAWAVHRPQSVDAIAEECAQTGMMGCQWQRGTRWQSGLAQAQIDRAEWRWGLRFPPDYRLFLRHLHAIDRPLLCPTWRAEIAAAEARLAHVPVGRYHGFQEGFLVLAEERLFPDWSDDGALQAAFAGIEQVVLPGDEWGRGGSLPFPARWPVAWGAEPSTPAERRDRLRELFAAAPRLIPIMTGHCLLAEPSRGGNPVLMLPHPPAVPGPEMVAPNLRAFFLDRFSGLLGVDDERVERYSVKMLSERAALYAAIPSWGSILSPLRWP